MRRPHLDHLPPLVVEAPYRLRTYRMGDEAAWAAIMNTGIGQGWTAARCRAFLIEPLEFRADGLYFAVRDTPDGEQVVGTTCAWRNVTHDLDTGIVHMVCVDPAHRGHRLGHALVLAVLHYFRAHGFRAASLSTDDWRRSAIRTYLNLGFMPELTDPSHFPRWAHVLSQLGGGHRGAPPNPNSFPSGSR